MKALETAFLPHPAQAYDLRYAGLFPAKAQRELLTADEVAMISRTLAEDGWGYCIRHGLSVVRALPWDTAHFGVPSADMMRLYLLPQACDAEIGALIGQTVLEARLRAITFLSARLPTAAVQATRHLCAHHFSLIDTSIELGRRIAAPPPPPANSPLVRDATTADLETLTAIAETFTANRFFWDERIPRDKAHGVYRAWITAAVQGTRGQALVVCDSSDTPTGFMTYHSATEPLCVGTIGLVALAPKQRGRGAFDALVRACVHRLANASPTPAKAIVTSTQSANIPALRAFGRHGFLPHAARHVFHAWL